MVAQLAALGAALLLALAEVLHARRVRRLAALAFGPARRAAPWTRAVPALRVAAAAGLAWGLTTLLLLPGRAHKPGVRAEHEYRDLLLVLDVSPSMRLADAGPSRRQSRRQRARELLESFFMRAPMELYRTTIVAVYTEARPVVLRTTDPEVVRNILEDLPMEYAFKAGPTDLISGVKAAAQIAGTWRRRTTTLLIVSDGDTIPPTGLPKLPLAIAHVVVVGVGDPQTGKFIAGHLSRQDVSSLRQLATRLNGTYHDGNHKQLSTNLVRQVTLAASSGAHERLTRREYALLAVALGAATLSLLPLLLHLAGTSWRPGVRRLERRETIS
jgi:Ca-activated chloride channel family protein